MFASTYSSVTGLPQGSSTASRRTARTRPEVHNKNQQGTEDHWRQFKVDFAKRYDTGASLSIIGGWGGQRLYNPEGYQRSVEGGDGETFMTALSPTMMTTTTWADEPPPMVFEVRRARPLSQAQLAAVELLDSDRHNHRAEVSKTRYSKLEKAVALKIEARRAAARAEAEALEAEAAREREAELEREAQADADAVRRNLLDHHQATTGPLVFAAAAASSSSLTTAEDDKRRPSARLVSVAEDDDVPSEEESAPARTPMPPAGGRDEKSVWSSPPGGAPVRRRLTPRLKNNMKRLQKTTALLVEVEADDDDPKYDLTLECPTPTRSDSATSSEVRGSSPKSPFSPVSAGRIRVGFATNDSMSSFEAPRSPTSPKMRRATPRGSGSSLNSPLASSRNPSPTNPSRDSLLFSPGGSSSSSVHRAIPHRTSSFQQRQRERQLRHESTHGGVVGGEARGRSAQAKLDEKHRRSTAMKEARIALAAAEALETAQIRREEGWLVTLATTFAFVRISKIVRAAAFLRVNKPLEWPVLQIQRWWRKVTAPKVTLRACFRVAIFNRKLAHKRATTRRVAITVLLNFLRSNASGSKITKFIAKIIPAAKRIQHFWWSFRACTAARVAALLRLWDAIELDLNVKSRKAYVESAADQFVDLERTTTSDHQQRGRSSGGLDGGPLGKIPQQQKKRGFAGGGGGGGGGGENEFLEEGISAAETLRALKKYARVIAPLGREPRLRGTEWAKKVEESTQVKAGATGLRTKFNLALVQQNLRSRLENLERAKPPEALRRRLLERHVSDFRHLYKVQQPGLQAMLLYGDHQLHNAREVRASIHEALQLVLSSDSVDKTTGFRRSNYQSVQLRVLEAQEANFKKRGMMASQGKQRCVMPRVARPRLYTDDATRADIFAMIRRCADDQLKNVPEDRRSDVPPIALRREAAEFNIMGDQSTGHQDDDDGVVVGVVVHDDDDA